MLTHHSAKTGEFRPQRTKKRPIRHMAGSAVVRSYPIVVEL